MLFHEVAQNLAAFDVRHFVVLLFVGVDHRAERIEQAVQRVPLVAANFVDERAFIRLMARLYSRSLRIDRMGAIAAQ